MRVITKKVLYLINNLEMIRSDTLNRCSYFFDKHCMLFPA